MGKSQAVLAAGHNYTFVFNATLKAYITNGKGAGVGQSWPWPVQLALCRAVNAACWLELPLLWSTSSVASWSADIATNACRTCGGILTEISNEVWNFGNYQTTQAYSLGYSLGFVKGSFASYYGLRMAQFWPIITSAWGRGKRPSSHERIRLLRWRDRFGNPRLSHRWR